MSQVITLFRLQKIDNQREKINARLVEIEREINEDIILKEAQLLHEQALASRQAAHEQVRSSEESLSGIQIKLEHNQSAQFGGKLQSPKELQDLQNEQAALERRRKELEEEQINAMLKLETAEQTLIEVDAALSVAKEKNTSRLALLRGEKNTLVTDLDKSNAERQAVISTISNELVEKYEKLRLQKKGVAVTVISDGSCATCGSSLTPAECQAARSPSTIIHCSSCGRILYAG